MRLKKKTSTMKKKNSTSGLTEDQIKVLQESFGFHAEILEYGGNITLPELAEHMALQAGLRNRIAMIAEHSEYILDCATEEFNLWEEKVKGQILDDLEKKGAAVSTMRDKVKSIFIKKYGALRLKKKKKLFRLRKIARSAKAAVKSVDSKESMLQSIRNIIQDPMLKEPIMKGKIKINTRKLRRRERHGSEET